MTATQFFSALGIDPGDTDACKLVQNQLMSLEKYGLSG
jgi:hypothetical protein